MSEVARLRVLTLNVWDLGYGLSRHDRERMAWIARALPRHAPDAVAFQEVWTRESRDTLVAGARDAGLPHAWYNEAARTGSGLLLASRLPLEAAHFTPFTLGGLPQRLLHLDWWGGKGFVVAHVATRAGPVALVDTHLQAQYAEPAADEYRGVRVGQLVDFAAGVGAESAPVVAAGDFNLREEDGQHAVLTGLTGLRDAAIEIGRRQPTTLASSAYRERSRSAIDERIDYVFVRDGRDARVRVRSLTRVFDEALHFDDEPAAPSDHAGLLAELEIGPGPGGLPAPDPAAIESARRTLALGRQRAHERVEKERLVAVGATAAGSAALLGARFTRRRLLRAALAGVGGIGLGTAAGLGWLAFDFAADEQRGYDHVLATLATLADDQPIDLRRSGT